MKPKGRLFSKGRFVRNWRITRGFTLDRDTLKMHVIWVWFLIIINQMFPSIISLSKIYLLAFIAALLLVRTFTPLFSAVTSSFFFGARNMNYPSAALSLMPLIISEVTPESSRFFFFCAVLSPQQQISHSHSSNTHTRARLNGIQMVIFWGGHSARLWLPTTSSHHRRKLEDYSHQKEGGGVWKEM